MMVCELDKTTSIVTPTSLVGGPVHHGHPVERTNRALLHLGNYVLIEMLGVESLYPTRI